MDEIELVEHMEKLWPRLPKGQVWETYNKRRETVIQFALEVDGLWLYLAAVIGVRGGLHEEIIVIDPSQKFVIDRLLVAARSDMAWGYLLSLLFMREEIRKGGIPRVVCSGALADVMAQYMDEDNQKAKGQYLRRRERPPVSLHTVSGGAPGLGRRR